MEKSPSDGFHLIWYYWAKKYMGEKIRGRESMAVAVGQLKKHYSLEAVDSRQQLESKIAGIKEQRGLHTLVYIVDPERELTAMEAALSKENEEFKSELYSYYINIKNVFVLYCNEWEGSERLSSRGGSGEDNRDNISEGNPGYKASKMHDNRTEGNKSRPEQSNSSIVNKIFHSLEDECPESRQDSIYEGLEEKIEELEILDKMAEFEGAEIWNCKYKQIPHSYVKIKKDVWQSCFSLPLLHPAQPRFISDRLPILPRLSPLLPSPDHLAPLLAYLQLLDNFFPAFSPTVDSIFQLNHYPLILSRQEGAAWNEQSGVAMLCYSVVKGKDPKMNTTRVEKWAEANADTALARHIREMSKRQRERRRQKKEGDSKALGLFNGHHEEEQIW